MTKTPLVIHILMITACILWSVLLYDILGGGITYLVGCFAGGLVIGSLGSVLQAWLESS